MRQNTKTMMEMESKILRKRSYVGVGAKVIGLLLITVFAAGNCKGAKPAPAEVNIKQAGLYPEGVEYDAAGERFLVSSLTEGVVSEVKDDGTLKKVFEHEKLISAIGLRLDAKRNRLLVCSSDPGVSKKRDQNAKPTTNAGLLIFDLKTGKPVVPYVDLAALKPGSHFCNDIALDGEGNAYITNSFSPMIFKVTVEGKASIIFEDAHFAGQGFNFNGVVYKNVPGGKSYLLVDRHNDGTLYKVPLNPAEGEAKFTQVKVDVTFPGADGLLWGADGTLVLIANTHDAKNTTNKVVRLKSSDDWKTASVVKQTDTGDVFATTGVLRDGKIFVLHGKLNVLFNPATKTHADMFTIKMY